MRKRRLLRGLVAGAMAGLMEAAGLDRGQRVIRRPLRVVRLDDREPSDPLAGTGVWFIEPLPDPRPARADDRRPIIRRLRLSRLDPRRVMSAGN